MEKTNELNKFLSYIHMGMSVYRVYHEHAEKMNDEDLLNEIVKVEEIFKTHEESITKEINELGEDATESLTLAGIMGVYKEKMMIVDNAFSICLNAIKATNMGMLSALKFLEDNNNDIYKALQKRCFASDTSIRRRLEEIYNGSGQLYFKEKADVHLHPFCSYNSYIHGTI